MVKYGDIKIQWSNPAHKLLVSQMFFEESGKTGVYPKKFDRFVVRLKDNKPIAIVCYKFVDLKGRKAIDVSPFNLEFRKPHCQQMIDGILADNPGYTVIRAIALPKKEKFFVNFAKKRRLYLTQVAIAKKAKEVLLPGSKQILMINKNNVRRH
ncbi:MAG: hypothetical protein J4415_00950 [Candidatus Diapherotrites archaeon]|uniref:Uncharacterized protein n=1 Tax=Candidatus Iainarchaeum sp. TaxID=3101447 RepID=A0A8T4L252_9ARCH|nr:hypothetical protein [Candidatus Diapherotrites archaeon]